MFDFCVVGGGIAGCATAHFLTKAGKKVILIEQEGVASGGSGAAGAFLSPRLGQGSALQKITNEAFVFSICFYKKTVPHLLEQKGLIKLPKDEMDAQKFPHYQESLDLDFKVLAPRDLGYLTPQAARFGGLFFKDAAIVDAKKTCRHLVQWCEVLEGQEVQKPCFEDGVWHIGKILARNLILATGSYNAIVDIPHITIKRVCGHRYDAKTSTEVEHNIHRKVSVSCTRKDGTIAIGASHMRMENCKKGECPLFANDNLTQEALSMVALKDLRIVQTHMGIRAASPDHFPIVGDVIDAALALEQYPSLKKGTKIALEKLPRLANLFVINGFGGRGFVFGPYIASILCDFLLKNKPINPLIASHRFLYKWARRQ